MIANTNLKNIMAKTQTKDFFIVCKKSRVENNTSFYGCFYLGPFTDSLSQTLANDLRRTLLSELTGLAITSVEIEGVLHKFSSLPGMKETVLDLICNLQNIVLKKQEISLINITQRFTKKTYIGFLSMRGPRIIKAMDLKLPTGLQCVDPNQYIATLAEDGFLNMKFNINEGQNFIKQKPYNLDVNILKKRNILLQNFKKKYAISNINNTALAVPVEEITTAKGAKLQTLTPKFNTSISNPIPLDAIFMPITKINCIIEENKIYSDFSTDQTQDFSNQTLDFTELSIGNNNWRPKTNLLPTKIVYKNQVKTTTKQVSSTNIAYCDFQSFLNIIDSNSIYQICLVKKALYPNNYLEHQLSVSTNKHSSFVEDNLTSTKCKVIQNHLKLIPWQSNSLYFDIKFDNKHQLDITRLMLDACYQSELIYNNNNNSFANIYYQQNTVKRGVSKIKTFLAYKTSKKNSIFFNQQKENYINEKTSCGTLTIGNNTKLVTIETTSKNIWAKNVTGITLRNLYLEYAQNLKLKPLRKKSYLIVEIWTNGSIHPRQALYQSFIFLSNNFLKLQIVKMLGRKRIETFNISKGDFLNSSGGKYLQQITSSYEYLKSLKAPIGILKISLRTYSALKKAGIFNLKDLIKYSKKNILKIKNLGKKSLFEIETSLSFLGLTFKN